MTFYEIEQDWDYGYVEVHDLDTDEWFTLEDLNGNTVTTDPYAQDNPNVPDGREPMDYVAAGMVLLLFRICMLTIFQSQN